LLVKLIRCWHVSVLAQSAAALLSLAPPRRPCCCWCCASCLAYGCHRDGPSSRAADRGVPRYPDLPASRGRLPREAGLQSLGTTTSAQSPSLSLAPACSTVLCSLGILDSTRWRTRVPSGKVSRKARTPTTAASSSRPPSRSRPWTRRRRSRSRARSASYRPSVSISTRSMYRSTSSLLRSPTRRARTPRAPRARSDACVAIGVASLRPTFAWRARRTGRVSMVPWARSTSPSTFDNWSCRELRGLRLIMPRRRSSARSPSTLLRYRACVRAIDWEISPVSSLTRTPTHTSKEIEVGSGAVSVVTTSTRPSISCIGSWVRSTSWLPSRCAPTRPPTSTKTRPTRPSSCSSRSASRPPSSTTNRHDSCSPRRMPVRLSRCKVDRYDRWCSCGWWMDCCSWADPQTFLLAPDLAVGSYLRVDFHGHSQRQPSDSTCLHIRCSRTLLSFIVPSASLDRWYIAISIVRAYGVLITDIDCTPLVASLLDYSLRRAPSFISTLKDYSDDLGLSLQAILSNQPLECTTPLEPATDTTPQASTLHDTALSSSLDTSESDTVHDTMQLEDDRPPQWNFKTFSYSQFQRFMRLHQRLVVTRPVRIKPVSAIRKIYRLFRDGDMTGATPVYLSDPTVWPLFSHRFTWFSLSMRSPRGGSLLCVAADRTSATMAWTMWPRFATWDCSLFVERVESLASLERAREHSADTLRYCNREVDDTARSRHFAFGIVAQPLPRWHLFTIANHVRYSW